jgi:hypothetical protein
MNATRPRSQNWIGRNGWQALTVAMLSIIGGLMVVLITSVNSTLEKHETRIDSYGTDINDLQNICRNLVETYNGKREVDAEQTKQIMELWKCQKRSGSNNNSTLMK